MKTIGLLGGMSWESTVEYYRAINEGVKKSLGGLHSARIVLYSADFGPLEQLLRKGDWGGIVEILIKAAKSVEAGGADFLLICTNTMHKVAPEIEEAISIPVLHIADATAEKLLSDNVRRVGLLGTLFTMEEAFFKSRLKERFGMEVIIPEQSEREIVNNIIFSELCLGKISDSSRQQYLKVIKSLHEKGAEAVILGCTEIALLVEQKHTPVPLYDTTAIHAAQAVKYAISL